jgi:hypothetical protein
LNEKSAKIIKLHPLISCNTIPHKLKFTESQQNLLMSCIALIITDELFFSEEKSFFVPAMCNNEALCEKEVSEKINRQ